MMSVRPLNRSIVLKWLFQEHVATHLILIFILVFSICAGFIGPKFEMISENQSKLDQMNAFLIGTEEAAKRLKNIDGLLNERRQELIELQSKTLKPESVASMIQVFTEAIEALPLTILNIQPEAIHMTPAMKLKPPRWQANGFEKHRLQIRMHCRFQTLGRLLEQLEKSPLIFHLDKLSVDAGSLAAPMLDIKLTLASFVERSV